MRIGGFLAIATAVTAVVLLPTYALAAPYSDGFDSITNGSNPSPIPQWFQSTLKTSSTSYRELFDNLQSGGFPAMSWPWGGAASTDAIKGVIKNVALSGGMVVGFTVEASVTNDSYYQPGSLVGTSGGNSHGQSAGNISGQYILNLREVRLAAAFADDSIPGNWPATVAPFSAEEPNAYAVNSDHLAWYCYGMGYPPTPNGASGYWVPAWDMTGGSVTCNGVPSTPDVIMPGETHTRLIDFGLHTPVSPFSTFGIFLINAQSGNWDIFVNRTTSLKIGDYADELAQDTGIAFPTSPNRGSNVAVFFEPEYWMGSVALDYNVLIPNHYHDSAGLIDPDDEIMSIRANAVGEAVELRSITLQASGSGDSGTAVASVDLWNDVDHDGRVISGTDSLLASTLYSGVSATLSGSPLVSVPAGGTVDLIISYKMNSGIPPGRTYRCQVLGASATGAASHQTVSCFLPSSFESATLATGVPASIAVGRAKLNAAGSQVRLSDMIVTADFLATMGLLYVEEQSGCSGIGLHTTYTMPGGIKVGDRVQVTGTTYLLNGAELVVAPSNFQNLGPLKSIKAPYLNHRISGGARFGSQPGIWSGFGLNTVGSLVRVTGNITLSKPNCPLPPLMLPFPPRDIVWIDDGSGVIDGLATLPGGDYVTGVACLLQSAPPINMYLPFPAASGTLGPGRYGVTGILRAIPNWTGAPVRLLCPRSWGDVQ
ncbi:MAG: hypothetical protein M1133_11450 [Armatimonadetes bacterium]|nr:hypothetical protein [Armatimonadota bacterium]